MLSTAIILAGLQGAGAIALGDVSAQKSPSEDTSALVQSWGTSDHVELSKEGTWCRHCDTPTEAMQNWSYHTVTRILGWRHSGD